MRREVHVNKLEGILQHFTNYDDANAAVVLLLKMDKENMKVLFVKRVVNPTDRWSGQYALPGGRREAKDQNIKQTVIRETLEEICVNLLDRCRFLGTLIPVESRGRPEMKILPFVVLLQHDPVITLNEKELDRFVWISIKELLMHKTMAKFNFGEFPAYIIGNAVIWGLTYRILEKFIQIIDFQ